MNNRKHEERTIGNFLMSVCIVFLFLTQISGTGLLLFMATGANRDIETFAKI